MQPTLAAMMHPPQEIGGLGGSLVEFGGIERAYDPAGRDPDRAGKGCRICLLGQRPAVGEALHQIVEGALHVRRQGNRSDGAPNAGWIWNRCG